MKILRSPRSDVQTQNKQALTHGLQVGRARSLSMGSYKFVADDTLGLRCHWPQIKGRPLQNSQFGSKHSKHPSQGLPFTSLLESLPSPKMTASPDHGQGHKAVSKHTGFPFSVLVTLPLFLAQVFFLADPWKLLISAHLDHIESDTPFSPFSSSALVTLPDSSSILQSRDGEEPVVKFKSLEHMWRTKVYVLQVPTGSHRVPTLWLGHILH